MTNTTGYLDMELLRFTTAGSVDDGKSTLIGRLLYDSKAIFEDQLEAIEEASKRKGHEHIDLALLTDGLRAEREQGITIDVAYRYFATPKRKFIIADTPGHIQYTRNMVTGASTASAALILVDARLGVIEQTIRHAYIASLLRIPHIILCVNKMDLVDFNEEIFYSVINKFIEIADKLNILDVQFVPISAKFGDNVVHASKNMPWYKGIPLLDILETIPIGNDYNLTDGRFPVQYVIRPMDDKFHDYRGYAGRVAGGVFSVGDKVTVLPTGQKTEILQIKNASETLEKAFPPQSITLLLKDDIDISRGNMIVPENNLPQIGNELEVMICWLNEKPLIQGGKYFLRQTTADLRCIIPQIKYKVNINTLDENYDDKNIGMNEIACISIKTTKPVIYDSYKCNRLTGSIILIDEGTNETVGAGMIL